MMDQEINPDPRAFGPTKDPSHPDAGDEVRVVRSYTEEQAGQDIVRPEDVMRPINKKWCYQQVPQIDSDSHTWTQKSRARRPTYGSCLSCMKAEHVGKLCDECMDEKTNKRYHYWMMGHGEGKMKILDSITLAKIFMAGQETTKADHCYFPHGVGMQFKIFDTILLNHIAEQAAVRTKIRPWNPHKEEELAHELIGKFYEMLME